MAERREFAIIERAGLFDRDYYIELYSDVAASGMDPLLHYVLHGASEGRSPSAYFDAEYYLDRYPDVAQSGMKPFLHFCEFGQMEGRVSSARLGVATQVPASSIDSAGTESPSKARADDVDIIRRSGLFDAEHYLRLCPTLAETGSDPVEHYVTHGAREGRNPSALFDTGYYNRNNPDVAAAGINPFRHFCEFGWQELRNPSASFDIAWYWLVHMLPDRSQGNPLLHYVQTGSVEGAPIKSAGQLTASDKQHMEELAEQLLGGDGHDVLTYTRIGLLLVRLKRWATAEVAFRDAIGLKWSSPKNHFRMADVLVKQGKWWQAVESLLVATALDPLNANWFQRLGEAQARMNRFPLAAEAYGRAIEIGPERSIWHYELGYALAQCGQQYRSDAAYQSAIRLTARADVKRFGVGVLHQTLGRWEAAAKAYREITIERSLDAELWFRQGMALDRCYRWSEAEVAYEMAVALAPDGYYWHYRLGFVRERQEKWLEAAAAYSVAAEENSKRSAYRRYREGYVLSRSGHHEDACLAFLATRGAQFAKVDQAVAMEPRDAVTLDETQSSSDKYRKSSARLAQFAIRNALQSDYTNAEWHYQLGLAYERTESLDLAAHAYAEALARSNAHRPDWCFRLGYVLYRAGRTADACAAFEDMRILRRPFGVESSPYEKSAAVRAVMIYNEYFAVLPMQDHTILYESYHGASLACNPRAIFYRLLDDPAYEGWLHVWALNHMSTAPSHLKSRKNVVFVRRDSHLYRRYLCTASHLVNNNTFMPWFIRRPGQKYLNTWHGTPIKALGKDIRGEFLAHRNAARNLLHATHVISPNAHTSDVLIRQNDIGGSFRGKLAETGYPRVDRMLAAADADKELLRESLDLDPSLPVVLYAPTWRGTLGKPISDVENLEEDLQFLGGIHGQLLFRGHHANGEELSEHDLGIIVVPSHVDTSDLLSIVDVLVTDYSSIAVDFIPTGRPIIFYAHDLETYSATQGLYFPLDELPGEICQTREALACSLRTQLERPRVDEAKAKDARVRFSPHEDGLATDRVIDFFFHDDTTHQVERYVDGRRSLLVYAGAFIPNGITASCLNLVSSIDHGKYRVVVAVDAGSITHDHARLAKISELPAGSQIMGRIGIMNSDPEERYVIERLNTKYRLDSSEIWTVYAAAFQREFLRMYGYGQFDVAVQFDGYSRFWSSLFAFGPSAEMRRVIWLHNDMMGEWETRFPYLSAVFDLYQHYDRLVSVSESVHRLNQDHLAKSWHLPLERFARCNNLLNTHAASMMSREPLRKDIEEWAEGAVLFGTLGRLSPEKGHRKLILAFNRVLQESGKNIKLAIAGDGPLKLDLTLLIQELDLEERVWLVGLLPNPYPLLKRLDLFVFSSDYEGQGLAIMEALLFDKPVVSTDVVGPRSILESGAGLLVENNICGLAGGMQRYLGGNLDFAPFDFEAYQLEALRAFDQLQARLTRKAFGRRPGRMVIAARRDGLGERMNAMLNGMYLAERLGLDFAFRWDATGTWERNAKDTTQHAVIPADQFFSHEFIRSYYVDHIDSHRYMELAGREMHREDIVVESPDPKFGGWLAPRLDLVDILAADLWPNHELSLGMMFRKIGFSDSIQKAITIADNVQLPDNCVALHLRSGDIFYGSYRKKVHYTYKGLTLPIAKALTQRLRADGHGVLLFGEDKKVLEYLRDISGAHLVKDLAVSEFCSTAEQAMFEITLMSRCQSIVAGSSGFAKVASWIGGIPLRQSSHYFDYREQTRISVADLADNANVYHPLQTAFAYWYAYFYGRHVKSVGEADELLLKASAFDPDNQLYPIKRAVNFFRSGRFDDGEEVLRQLVSQEYTRQQSTELPMFEVLTGKIVGKFNLADDFGCFAEAAKRGLPYSSVCHYVVQRAHGDDTAFDTLSNTLSSSSSHDTIAYLLQAAWAASNRVTGAPAAERL